MEIIQLRVVKLKAADGVVIRGNLHGLPICPYLVKIPRGDTSIDLRLYYSLRALNYVDLAESCLALLTSDLALLSFHALYFSTSLHIPNILLIGPSEERCPWRY